MSYKNDLLLRALKGEKLARPPVWMMRQAGRYLPDFMKLKKQYDFFTRCRTPELATEITLMPIRQLGTDAAILFSDILVVPQAMNIHIEMKPDMGPWVPYPIRSQKAIDQVIVPNIEESLGYVLEAVKMTKKALNNEIPLIGFAGAPWTVFCYAVEGKGSKSFNVAKAFCFQQREAAHQLLQKFTDVTIQYLLEKVAAGCDVVQIFDSWGGLLSPQDYQEFSWKYTRQIVEKVSQKAPVIVFAKGCWFALKEMAQSKVSALGVDWTISPKLARQMTGRTITLQGNFDPAALLAPVPEIKTRVKTMIKAFGVHHYIANLGHGILPNVPVDHAKAFIDAVKDYQC